MTPLLAAGSFPDLTPDKLFWVVLAVVPGFVAIRIYALWYPVEKQKDIGSALVEAVTYSTLNVLIWLLFIRSEIPDGDLFQHPWHYPGMLFLYCFLSPAVLAWLCLQLRLRVLPRYLSMDHPTRTAWDWFVSNYSPFFIRFILKSRDKDDKPMMVGGYYGENSYASTYPEEPEIYVEEVWYLNPESGVFEQRIEGSLGMVIRLSECERVEFHSSGEQTLTGWRIFLYDLKRVWNWFCKRIIRVCHLLRHAIRRR